FFLGNFARPRDQTLIERVVVILGAKFARELVREFGGQIDILDAALLQEAASRSALSGAGDFAPIRQNICADWVRKTIVGRDSALRCPRTPQRDVPTFRQLD